MGINLQDLNNSSYVLQSQNQSLGRTIYRYLLENNTINLAIQAAQQACLNLNVIAQSSQISTRKAGE